MFDYSTASDARRALALNAMQAAFDAVISRANGNLFQPAELRTADMGVYGTQVWAETGFAQDQITHDLAALFRGTAVRKPVATGGAFRFPTSNRIIMSNGNEVNAGELLEWCRNKRYTDIANALGVLGPWVDLVGVDVPEEPKPQPIQTQITTKVPLDKLDLNCATEATDEVPDGTEIPVGDKTFLRINRNVSWPLGTMHLNVWKRTK